MSSRLDQEREKELQPQRMVYAKRYLKEYGFDILFEDATRLEFEFNGKIVKFYPYSGWHSGASIKDGRGLQNILKQLTP